MRQTGGRQAFKLRRGGAGKTPSRRKKYFRSAAKAAGKRAADGLRPRRNAGEIRKFLRFGNAVFYLRKNPAHSARKNPPAAAFILIPRENLRAGKLRPAAPSGAEGNGARQHPKLSPKNCGRSLRRRKIFRRFSKRFPLSERKILHKKPHSKVSATNAGKIKTLANNRNPLTSRDRDGTPRFAASSGAAAQAQTAGGVSPAARQTSKPAADRFCPLRGSPPPRPFRRRVSAFRKPRS